MQPVPMPAPYGGVNELLPVIALQSPQCENLFNFNTTDAGLVLRKGDSVQRTIDIPGSALRGYILLPISSSNEPPRVMLYDITAGLFRVVNSQTGVVEYSAPGALVLSIDTLYFNKYFFVFTGSLASSFAYNTATATYSALGYTGTGFAPIGGNTYNRRAYMVSNASTVYWYSNVDAISGPVESVDIGMFTEEQTNLRAIASFTLSDQVSAVQIQSFIFYNGEILFYSGSYPNSPDWTIVQATKVGAPLGDNPTFKYQGDSLLLTESGIVSLRDLFLKGSQAATSLSVNARVQATWKALCQGISTLAVEKSSITGVYDTVNNRIIVSFPLYIDSTGTPQPGSFYFVFDTLRESWSFHRSYGVITGDSVVDMVTANNGKVYFLVNVQGGAVVTICIKEGATDYTDRDSLNTTQIGYDYDIISAPISVDNAYVQMLNGMDAIWKTDLTGQTNFTFIKDLGVQETTPQLIPPYGTAGTLQKPYVNAGIEGSYVQYEISGTTVIEKTVGLELYGTTMWIQKGEGQTR